MRKEISSYEEDLKKLEKPESKYSGELEAALQEYAEMKQQAENFDPVELYRARKAIRLEKEADAENHIQRGFGTRFSFTRFWESRHQTDYDLYDYADSERVRILEREAERQNLYQRQRKPKSRDMER